MTESKRVEKKVVFFLLSLLLWFFILVSFWLFIMSFGRIDLIDRFIDRIWRY